MYFPSFSVKYNGASFIRFFHQTLMWLLMGLFTCHYLLIVCHFYFQTDREIGEFYWMMSDLLLLQNMIRFVAVNMLSYKIKSINRLQKIGLILTLPPKVIVGLHLYLFYSKFFLLFVKYMIYFSTISLPLCNKNVISTIKILHQHVISTIRWRILLKVFYGYFRKQNI